jgi:Transcriptional Coactivator p15 (PC4)
MATSKVRGPGKDPGPDRRETVHTFAKNSSERVLASLSHFKGETYLDLRVFYDAGGGELHPTKKGVTLAVDLLEELERSVALLRAAVEARGLAA